MFRKMIATLLLPALILTSGSATALATPVTADNYEVIHEKAMVVDSHNDTMMRILDGVTWLPTGNLGDLLPTQLNLPKAKMGGLDVAFYAAFTKYYDQGLATQTPRTNSRTLALINGMYYTERLNPDSVAIVTDLKGIHQAAKAGKHAMIPAIEGAYALEDYNAIELLRQYYDLGVRYVTLVWNPANSLGAGTTGPEDMGLTDLGRQVIDEMNRLGMMVDVSHMNETTFWDTIKYSDRPILASHSSVTALVAHPRNLTDEQIKAVAASGGVVNINFWNTLLSTVAVEATISDLVDHIDYIANLVGTDYVGLGSDFDGAAMPVDLPDASYLPLITKELVERGYSSHEIEKILGLNTLRVMKQVQNMAVNEAKYRGVLPEVTAELSMGDIVNDPTPTLTAQATTNGRKLKETAKVIVDGIASEVMIDSEGHIAFEVPEDLLINNFHVVTFEVMDQAGKVDRETVIFYVQ